VAAVSSPSRVYVKIHHTSDVLAGVAVGVGLGLAGRKLWPLPPVEPPDGLPETGRDPGGTG
jgi:hypothetical protein